MKYDRHAAAKRFQEAWDKHKQSGPDEIHIAPHWMDYLIPPLAEEICREKGWDGFQISGPAGICCRVWIDFFKQGENVFYLEVHDPDLDTGSLCVTNYVVNTGEFPPGSIGDLNGMNHPRQLITVDMTVDEVLVYGGEPREDDDLEINPRWKFWEVK